MLLNLSDKEVATIKVALRLYELSIKQGVERRKHEELELISPSDQIMLDRIEMLALKIHSAGENTE
jgi:hypothetical protein